jgi:putative transposase
MDLKPTRNVSTFRNTSKAANAEIGVPSKTLVSQPMWHSRGYLPHFESPDTIQHVTFHLADSLAEAALQQIEAGIKTLPEDRHKAERWKRLEAWLDAGNGSCILRKPAIADMVQHSLLTFDADRYRLLAWVVMPNHVHVLFEPMDGWTTAKIVASWKRFTATKIHAELAKSTATSAGQAVTGNANLRIGGFSSGKATSPVWHREYWDRYIRDERHLNRTIEYIHLNPVKAGLAATPASWPWSSANSHYQTSRM